jgi:hypothetical protein
LPPNSQRVAKLAGFSLHPAFCIYLMTILDTQDCHRANRHWISQFWLHSLTIYILRGLQVRKGDGFILEVLCSRDYKNKSAPFF